MVAGGGEVMGEGVTAELVIGRTEKKLLMLMLRIARDWWISGEFFSRVLTWRFCQSHRLLFWSSQLHNSGFHKDSSFVAQQNRSTAGWGLFRKKQEK